MLTKEQIRTTILYRLKIQKEEDRNKKSSRIKAKLFKNRIFKRAKMVMFYMSFGGEVETGNMIKEALRIGKTVVVPVIGRRRIMRPCLLKRGAPLLKGPYGILEPVMKQHLDVSDIDVVIVPGLAFDKTGARLGRGKGYYDRFLKTVSQDTASIGLAFDFQVLPRVPTARYDVSVNTVLFA